MPGDIVEVVAVPEDSKWVSFKDGLGFFGVVYESHRGDQNPPMNWIVKPKSWKPWAYRWGISNGHYDVCLNSEFKVKLVGREQKESESEH